MHRFPACAVLFAIALALPSLSPTPAAATPAPLGPGAAIHAVENLLEALDAGEVGRLQSALVDSDQQDAYGVVFEDGVMREAKAGDTVPAFFADVDAIGGPLRADTARDFAVALNRQSGTGKNGELKTRVRSVRAMCSSPECSWAGVDFDRQYTTDGATRVLPLRATALMRYAGGKSPSFEIFHWHASLRDRSQ